MVSRKYLTTVAPVLLFAATFLMPAHADIRDQHEQHDLSIGGHTGNYGSAGIPGNVDRVIEITAFDIGFDPAAVVVNRGETIRFVVTNKGNLLHELVIGTEEEQHVHAEEMSTMSAVAMAEHMHGKDNSVFIEPGETRELIWTFSTELEQLQFACHVPGHYAAGMFGPVKIYGGRLRGNL